MKIYVASSWRNPVQPQVVARLRKDTSHIIYDFREDQPGGARGFHWSEIDPKWESWNVDEYMKALEHPLAERGFKADMSALENAQATLLVLPCNKSAHLELGYAAGHGQLTALYMPDDFEIEDAMALELMYKMVDHLLVSMDEVSAWAKNLGKVN